MSTRAVMVIHDDGPDPEKQQAAIIEHAETHGFRIVALCRSALAALAVIKAGLADAVLAAYDRHGLGNIVRAAGGAFHAVRDAVQHRVRRDLAPLVRRMGNATSWARPRWPTSSR
jgi:hypothetical protein